MKSTPKLGPVYQKKPMSQSMVALAPKKPVAIQKLSSEIDLRKYIK
jgi:hypothetical protein